MLPLNREAWHDLAEMCSITYGTQVDCEEEYFICPECGEPIYLADWPGCECFTARFCPVCLYSYAEDFMEIGTMAEDAEWGTF